MPEAWLRGPVEDVDPWLMPAAHGLIQAREEIVEAAAGLSTAELWVRPGGAASIGFHLQHVAGSIDRLLTYARGEALDREQLLALRAEGEAGDPPAEAEALLDGVARAVDAALEIVRTTPRERLLEPRAVGRAALPSNVLGLLAHVAEHTERHAGQVVTTVKIVRGLGLASKEA